MTIWAGSIALRGDEHDALRWFIPVEAAGLQSLALDGYRDIVRRLLATID